MKSLIFLISLILLLPVTLCAAEVRVLAAASLKGVIAEIATSFEERYPQHKVLISTASSGTLARQIAAGAPADLFLSANPKWMEHLVSKGKVEEGQPVSWASNRLVVVGRGKPLASLKELQGLKRIAIGSPESTPVGRYAQQILEEAGIYQELQEQNRLVMSKDVWQALLYAEQGVVDASIIYESDSLLAEKSQVILTPRAELQPSASYPVALTLKGQDSAAAEQFFTTLQISTTAVLLEKYGLRPLFAVENN